MKCKLSRVHILPWPSLHSTSLHTYETHTSSVQFNSFYLIWIHVTLFHFTPFLTISTIPSFHLICHFPNLFPKITGLQKSP
jgi:hypothetical protein